MPSKPDFYPSKKKFTPQHSIFKSQPKQLSSLMLAYTLGNKKGLSRKDRKAHKNLNLLHLFTPSGLHFSSIYYFLFSLFSLLPRKFSLLRKLSTSLILLFPFFIPGYWSMKRIALLKVTSLIPKRLNLSFDLFYFFVLVFSLDFCLGTFRFSKLSFIFSFLFLGIIFAMLERPKFYMPFALLGGQVIVAYFFEDSLTSTGFIFGYILTLIFPLFFPIFLLGILFPDTISSLSFQLLAQYKQLILLLSELALRLGSFNASIPLILIFILPKKKSLITTFLFVHASVCF